MKVGAFQCGDIIFDIYDSERVPAGNESSNYYVTPKRLAQIDKWRIENNITDQIKDPAHLALFIKKGWLQAY